MQFKNNAVNTTFVYIIESIKTLFLFLIALFALIILLKIGPCNKNKTHHKYHKSKDYGETETESSCSR